VTNFVIKFPNFRYHIWQQVSDLNDAIKLLVLKSCSTQNFSPCLLYQRSCSQFCVKKS